MKILKNCSVVTTNELHPEGFSKLHESGADVYHFPMIKTESLNIKVNLKNYSCLIFTSKKYRRSNKNFNQKVSAIYRNLVLNLLVQKKNTHFMCISKNTQSDLLNQHTNASIKTSVNYLGPSKMIDELISTAITKRKNGIIVRGIWSCTYTKK